MMTRPRRDIAKLSAVLCLACAGPVAPAWAQDAPTGGAAPDSAPPVTTASGGATYGAPGEPSLVARPATLLGRTLHFRGTIPGAPEGARVIVERLDPRRGWLREAGARVRADGRFLARWRTDRSGRFDVRARLAEEGTRARAASADAAVPSTAVAVFRPAVASWYGPGFFGRRTACGQEMTPQLHGVAHKTLKCGTRVEILFGGRTITVPVVDRGPFVRGRTWDLTQATARALDFDGTARVGTIRAPAPSGP